MKWASLTVEYPASTWALGRSPWFALHEVLRPDLHRLKDEGMELLSELAIDTEVVLRCFRTGGITHTGGDHQVVFKSPPYLIDVHKRKDDLRGKQGKEPTRETYDSQPTARRLIGRHQHDGVGHSVGAGEEGKGGDDGLGLTGRPYRRSVNAGPVP